MDEARKDQDETGTHIEDIRTEDASNTTKANPFISFKSRWQKRQELALVVVFYKMQVSTLEAYSNEPTLRG